jgi:hypothetical protein
MFRIGTTVATVSTLLTTVGFCHTPEIIGSGADGALRRGMPRSPISDDIRADSSPHS